jgi:hypothetical protein
MGFKTKATFRRESADKEGVIIKEKDGNSKALIVNCPLLV